jgi:hypothetical protein
MGDLLDDFATQDDALGQTDSLGLLGSSNPPQADSSLDGMLGDADDDDLFGGAPPQPAPVSSQPPSALIAWQRAKDAELQEKDGQEAQVADDLKGTARASLDTFTKTIADAQEKRRVHNAELDVQKKADLESQSGNQWERVVKFVDFNRSDLHERDIAKFKTLLLQLKH